MNLSRLARLRSESVPTTEPASPPAPSPAGLAGEGLAERPRAPGPRCPTCGEPVAWAVRRNRERAAVEVGTTEPHRCLLRVVTVPIGPPAVIETAEGVVIRGYRVPADYLAAGSNEVVFVGRVVRSDEGKPEALTEREEGRRG